jgi:hypothetical protein
MKLTRTLILEDDLETLSKILGQLAQLEEVEKIEFSVTVISESPHVDELINNNPSLKFDLILLDRDCKIGGSFHNLDIHRFGVDNIIAISSVPDYNEQMRQKGVTRIVHKDYSRLDEFIKRLSSETLDLLSSK